MATHILIDGTIKEVQPENGTDFSLKELQGFVGGLIEIVRLPSGKLMIVDEEGRIKEKELNRKATLIAEQVIVGDVLVCDDEQVK